MSATATTTAPDSTAPDTTQTAAEATPDTSSNPIDSVIARLDPASARIKWWTAFAVMTLPALGFVASLYLLITGHLQAQDAVLFAVFYFLHMGGITMGFHRYLSHKAFKTSRPVEAVLMACGSMAAQARSCTGSPPTAGTTSTATGRATPTRPTSTARASPTGSAASGTPTCRG